jgi:hypothetical protein
MLAIPDSQRRRAVHNFGRLTASTVLFLCRARVTADALLMQSV